MTHLCTAFVSKVRQLHVMPHQLTCIERDFPLIFVHTDIDRSYQRRPEIGCNCKQPSRRRQKVNHITCFVGSRPERVQGVRVKSQ